MGYKSVDAIDDEPYPCINEGCNYHGGHKDLIEPFVIDYEEHNFESIFRNSTINFMNPEIKGEEAYFGANNPLKTELIAAMSELRSFFDITVDTNKALAERKDAANEMKRVCKTFEEIFKKHFNLEKAYFGLFNDLNAFAFPLCWDANLIKVSENKRTKSINKEFRLSLEDIIETTDGFKYKDPSGKIYVIGFGLGFFHSGYTIEECCGVVLHECGHAMQQMMVGINTNLANVYIQSVINSIYHMFSPIFIFMPFIWVLNLITGFLQMKHLNSVKKVDEKDLGDAVIFNIIGEDEREFQRDSYGRKVKTDTQMATAFLVESKKPEKKTFGQIIGRFFLRVLFGIFATGKNLLYPFVWLLNIPQHILFSGNMKFLRQNKKWEQFADMFSVTYGLGKEQASALAKLGQSYRKINLYALNWLNYVPILNLVLNFSHYKQASMQSLLAGYPDSKKRIVGLYATCKFEIEHNQDLTPSMKSELMADMNSIQKVYDDFVFTPITNPRGFVYSLWHKITRASIEKESSDIEGNVLRVLEELKEEAKLANSDTISKQTEPVKIEKNKIVNGILKVLSLNKKIKILDIPPEVENEIKNI
jgi:hypothetical protein